MSRALAQTKDQAGRYERSMARPSSTKISGFEEAAWLHNFVLRGNELNFLLSRFDGFRQHAEYCRRRARQRLGNLCGPQVMREKKVPRWHRLRRSQPGAATESAP